MTCRFPDEGGTLGSTALPTVRACLQGGPERVGTFAWEMHENSVAYWHAPNPSDQTILHTTGRDPASMSLADWAYFAGVVQSEGLHEYIRNFRRRMFDSAAAVFWMYNDCWPAVRSWSIVDYYARRTPAFHPVRRSFQSCALALAQDGADIKVFGVNEGPEIRAQLRYGIFALAGGLPFERRANAVLPANSATVLAAFPARRWRALGVRTHGAFAILSRNGTEVARDRLFLPRVNEMRLPRARVTVRWADGKAVFRSRAFAWNVCLDLDGEKKLPDNFFDVLPGIPTVLDWPARLGKPRIIRIANP
jgi:beta-mannosidase